MFTKVKTSSEIAAMRESGKMLATVLELLRKEITAGMSTKDLANRAARELKSLGGEPSFLGYHGYPDVLCVSVNDEVVHGIPSPDRIIKNGNIVSMDFGVTYKGMITDAAISVIVGGKGDTGSTRGKGDKRVQQLVGDTENSLLAGIEAACGGCHVGDIAAAVQTVLDKGKYGIVRDLVGHGVGHELHEDPNIPNYGRAGRGPVLLSGMTIAIEPMATLGGHEVYVDTDKWTILTRDQSWAAHFEHTILLTDSGSEILTKI